MSITIKRSTGWQGSGSKIKIKVNGKKVASVAENQAVVVELPHDQADLKVSQFWSKSSRIAVEDGDIIELLPTRWYRMHSLLFIVVMVLSIFIPEFYRWIAIFFVSPLLLISSFLFDGFYLKVLERGDQCSAHSGK